MKSCALIDRAGAATFEPDTAPPPACPVGPVRIGANVGGPYPNVFNSSIIKGVPASRRRVPWKASPVERRRDQVLK
jgi:hypothetical protein